MQNYSVGQKYEMHNSKCSHGLLLCLIGKESSNAVDTDSLPGLKIPWKRKWQPTSNILAWKTPWTEEPGTL